MAAALSDTRPIELLRPSLTPWRGGVLTMDGVISRLRDFLPPTFEDLRHDFAVGVVGPDGEHLLIDSGPLPEAVAASAAIPFVFSNVEVPGTSGRMYKDGGCVDRVGVAAWRQRRRRQQLGASGAGGPLPGCLVHVITRSSPFSGADDPAATGEPQLHVVQSPKSGVSFFDLGEFEAQFEQARSRAASSLRESGVAVVQQPGAGAPVAAAGAAPAVRNSAVGLRRPSAAGNRIILASSQRSDAARN